MAREGEGMIVSVIPADQAPAVIRAMTKDPLRIAITPSPPVVWLTLIANKLNLDQFSVSPDSPSFFRPNTDAHLLEYKSIRRRLKMREHHCDRLGRP